MSEPRPLIPALKPFYDFVVPLTWPMVRIAAGWNLFVHAYLKLQRGPMNTAPAFKQMGFTPEWIYVYGSLAVELGGVVHHLRVVHALLRGGLRPSKWA